MTPARCASEGLVEARRDGRLGKQQAASVERHLATCASCSALAAKLDAMADFLRTPLPVASPLEHHRGRIRLVQESAHGPEVVAPKPAWSRRAAVLTAAVASAMALLLWATMGTPAWLSNTRPTPSAAASVRSAPPGPVIESATARVMTTVTAEPGTRFSRTESGGTDVVSLDDGVVTLAVRPLHAGERFLVKTGDADVEVQGTIFTVAADAGRIRTVAVTEGKVEVRFRDITFVVAAGETWLPSSSSLGSARTMEPEPVPRAASLASGSARRETPKNKSASKVESTPKDELKAFAEGVEMIAQGDYGAAAKRLDAFAAAHPRSQSAEDAAFLVIIALERAGRRPEAASAARRYLDRYPHGFRRAEAEAVMRGPDAR